MLIIVTDEQKNRYVRNSHRSVELGQTCIPGLPDAVPQMFFIWNRA